MSTDDLCEDALGSSSKGESTTLNEILRGVPDPRLASLRTLLSLLNCPASGPWLDAAGALAEVLAITRKDELMTRLDAREALEQLASSAENIIALTDRADVLEALQALAPAGGSGPDDVTGYEYLSALAGRAKTAAAGIRSGSGRDTLLAGFGYPTARLLCAAMVRSAWRRANGRTPGSKNPKALEACAALWRASGGEVSHRVENGETDEGGSWERHLRVAGGKADDCPAIASAHVTAARCLRVLRQKAP